MVGGMGLISVPSSCSMRYLQTEEGQAFVKVCDAWERGGQGCDATSSAATTTTNISDANEMRTN